MNFSIQQLLNTTRISMTTKIYITNTYFFTEIKNYDKINRWLKNEVINDLNLFCVPIHYNGNHWSLAVCDITKNEIVYHDSLHILEKRQLESLLGPLVEYLNFKLKEEKKNQKRFRKY